MSVNGIVEFSDKMLAAPRVPSYLCTPDMKEMYKNKKLEVIPYTPVTHGVDCDKVYHLGEGYLHRADDDTPYPVDGLMYCGRCHTYLGKLR